ncbi:hypothetical protein [Methanosarcina sp. 2.H.T.1A.8]|nr:hypothetical protein [Methanosarcina sp. 2.H.T.1A.8]
MTPRIPNILDKHPGRDLHDYYNVTLSDPVSEAEEGCFVISDDL